MNITLLRKELFPLLWATLVYGLLAAAGLAMAGEYGLSYGPPSPSSGDLLPLVALTLLLTGLALGLWQFEIERVQGTEAYLHLRPTGAGGAFAAKLAAAWLALLVFGLETLLLHAAWVRAATPFGGAAQWSRMPAYAALAPLALAGHALGVFAAHLPTAAARRIGAALLGAAALYFISHQASLRWQGQAEAALGPMLGVPLLLTAGLLAGAAALARARVEPGREPAPRLALLLLPLQLMVFGSVYALVPGALQRLLLSEEDGLPARLVDTPGGGVSCLPAGQPAPPEADVLFDPRYHPLAWASDGPPLLERRFRGTPFDPLPATLSLLGDDPEQPLGWYDRAARCFRLYVCEDGRPVELRSFGPDASGTPFSVRSLPVFGSGTASLAFVDLETLQAWHVHRTPEGEPRVDPAPLPAGERLLGVDRVHSARLARVGLFEPYGVSDWLVARGEEGVFSFGAEGWQPFEPGDDVVLESALPARAALRLQRAGDGLHPAADVLDASGGDPLWRIELAAPSALMSGLAQAATLLRPPLCALLASRQPLSMLDAPSTPWAGVLADLALVGGERPWLVVLDVLVAVALALHVRRRLDPGPQSAALRTAWVIAVLLGGLAAAMVFGLVRPVARPACVPALAPRVRARASVV